MKNIIYNVYILTEDVPWAGMTQNIRNRMYVHKSLGRITNTKNHRVLHTTTDKSEAMELEALLHDEGYLGRHLGGNRNASSGHIKKMNEAAALATSIPVLQYTKCGKFIKEFVSQKEAGRQLNLGASHINKVCRGKRKTHGGFVFRYKEELAC